MDDSSSESVSTNKTQVPSQPTSRRGGGKIFWRGRGSVHGRGRGRGRGCGVAGRLVDVVVDVDVDVVVVVDESSLFASLSTASTGE